MAIIECPTKNDLPAYQYVISLDGTNYTLTFTFNDRMGKWFLNLGDATNNPIINQVPIIASMPLFNRFVGAAIPPGTLFAFDTSGQDMDPGRFDLGDRVRLLYAEEGTL
jgi:hypothetical protein